MRMMRVTCTVRLSGGRPQLNGLVLAALTAATATSNGQAPLAGDSTVQASQVRAVVEQPRPYGYFVGDLVTQRILLQAEGQAFTPITLLPVGRVSVWFERRRATIETDSALHRWLVVDYQVLNAPQKLTAVTLPAWELAVRPSASASGAAAADTGVANSGAGVANTGVANADSAGAAAANTSVVNSDAAGARAANTGAAPRAAVLKIPAALINVAPLSPPGSPAQVGVGDLRPDRSPPVIVTAPIRRAMTFWSGALGLTLIAWLAWWLWRNSRSVATQPFARALREMRQLDDREPRTWQAMHRAFDRTAGRVIQSATLPALFASAPHFGVVRAQIEKFFLQSSALFFGGGSSAELISPRELCIELRRIERGHER
jgi:mxaA protein